MNSDELLSETVRAVSEALEKSDITKHLDSLFEMRRNDMLNPKFLPLEKQNYWRLFLPRVIPTSKRVLILPDEARIGAVIKKLMKHDYLSPEYIHEILNQIHSTILDEVEVENAASGILFFHQFLEKLGNGMSRFKQEPENEIVAMDMLDSNWAWITADILRTTGFNVIANQQFADLFALVTNNDSFRNYSTWCGFLKKHFQSVKNLKGNEAEQLQLPRKLDFQSNYFSFKQVIQEGETSVQFPLLSKLVHDENKDVEHLKKKILSGYEELKIDELLKLFCGYLPNTPFAEIEQEYPSLFQDFEFHASNFFNTVVLSDKNRELGVFLKAIAGLNLKIGRVLEEEVNVPPSKKLETSLENPDNVIRYLNKRLVRKPYEVCLVLFLNNRNCVVHEMEISIGTINRVLIDPKQVFAPAIQLRCSSLIVAHNHPAGDPEPSSQDNKITATLKKTGDIIGIPLLDHIIIGKSGYYSYQENFKLL